MKSLSAKLFAAFAVLLIWCGHAAADDKFITVASTTSTEQSGLFGYLLPRFTEASGIAVKVVAVGAECHADRPSVGFPLVGREEARPNILRRRANQRLCHA